MATFSDFLGRTDNDIKLRLQMQAWQQSVILSRSPSDVIAASRAVNMSTAHDGIADVEKDNRFLSARSGTRSANDVL